MWRVSLLYEVREGEMRKCGVSNSFCNSSVCISCTDPWQEYVPQRTAHNTVPRHTKELTVLGCQSGFNTSNLFPCDFRFTSILLQSHPIFIASSYNLLVLCFPKLFIVSYYYAPPSRPEGPRRWPDRGNAGGALVFSSLSWLLYAMGLYTYRKIHLAKLFTRQIRIQ